MPHPQPEHKLVPCPSVALHQQLQMLGSARRVLQQARSVGEVRELRDKAAAIRAYAQKARLGRELIVEASVIRVEAERRLGELIASAELATATHGNQHTQGTDAHAANGVLLRELGVTKGESSRLQRLARVSPNLFTAYLDRCTADQREATTAAALRLLPREESDLAPTEPAAARREDQPPTAPGVAVRDLSLLVESADRFGTIYADPPWPYANQATRAATSNHFPTVSLDDIKSLPISRLADDEAHLHLWTTNDFLPQAFDVLAAWGFAYKSCLIWIKPQLGPGSYWRLSHEFLLLGVRGELTFRDQAQRSWVAAPRTSASEKPPIVRELVERVSPGPYLELFGRSTTPGWTTYGDQVDGGS